ncbi:MAG TPA: GEVED domain-containing protein [Bacteroidia bacterium]|nr:GEVED domain-containing protein [Bacteroidia bacterium]
MNRKYTILFLAYFTLYTANAQIGVGPAPYCMPTYFNIPCNQPGVSNAIGNSVNDFIDDFNTAGGVTNITTNGTGCQTQLLGGIQQNYINYACPTHLRANAGANITCNFLSGITYAQGFAVFVDWNKDCVYSMAEQVCGTPNTPPAATPASANFVIPAATANGAYKMRVRCAFATIGTAIDPCINYSFGETHEYTLYVGVACNGALSVCTVLPIEMNYFNVVALENAAEIIWGTATESNNSYFTIERSFNMNDFTFVQKVAGAGTSNKSHDYSVIDPEVNKSGTTYYRIKQFDYNGNLGHSEVINITMNKRASGLKLIPDPADDFIKLVLPNSFNGNILSVEIRDIKGATQKTNSNFDLNEIERSIELDLQNLDKGVYFITIIGEDGTIIKDKFIKN